MKVMTEMKSKGLRVEIDNESKTMGKKIRDAQQEKVNYIVTIGEKEVEKNVLAVRTMDGEVKFDVDVDGFIAGLVDEAETKKIK
mgnify:FL=1